MVYRLVQPRLPVANRVTARAAKSVYTSKQMKKAEKTVEVSIIPDISGPLGMMWDDVEQSTW